MAAQASDYNIRIRAETLGEAEIGKLADHIDSLAADAGDAAPRIRALAEQIRGLSEQQGLITGFANLKRETLATGEASAAAQARVAELAAQIAAATNPSRALSAEFERAKASARAAAANYDANTIALQRMRDELAAAGIKTSELASAQVVLNQNLKASVEAVEVEKAAALAAQDRAAEELRLAQIVEESKRRMAAAAQAELAAEQRAYAESEAAAQRLAQTQAAAAERSAVLAGSLASAFSATGVRSAAALQAEITRIDQSLIRLANDTAVSGAEFDLAWVSGQERIAALRAEMAGATESTGALASSAKTAAASLMSMAGPLAGLFAVQQFVETNAQFDSLNRTLTQLYGSAEKAGVEFDYIKSTANRLGIEVRAAADSYLALTAATRGTTLEGKATKELFEAVAGAMGKLGKNSEETQRAILAVAQMASKGTVSMEELRGQLGDALPGALNATADALGITVPELTKMVESGNVLAEDMLPKLAEGLKKVYATGGEVEGLTSSWARFRNEISETFALIGESGTVTAMMTVLNALAVTIAVITRSFEYLGKTIGITIAFFANFDLAHPIASMKQWAEEVNNAAAKTDVFLQRTKKSMQGAAEAQDQGAQAAQKSGAAADQASGGWLKLQAAQTKAAADLKQYTIQAEKELEAHKARAAASNDLAQAFGAETEKMDVAAKSAADVAAASEALAVAKAKEAQASRDQVTAMQDEATKSGQVSEQKKRAIEQADQKAKALEAEADKTRAAADSDRIHSEALAEKALAYQDNSKRIDELRLAQSAAAEELAKAILQGGNDEQSKVRQRDATEKLSSATALYRDALTDAAAASDRNIAALQRSASATQSSLSIEKERLVTIRDVARARGDEVGAANAERNIRDIEIRMLQAQAAAARAQADAILLAVKAKRAELEATNALTPAAKAELDARIAEAEAKKLDAERSEILADRIDAVARASQQLRYDGDGACDGLTQGFERAADASDRLNDSIRRRPRDSGSGSSGSGSSVDWRHETSIGGQMGSNAYGIGLSFGGLKSGEGNTVNRDVTTTSIDNRADAIRLGLVGDQIDRYVAAFGDLLTKSMQEMQGRLAGMPTTTTRYVDEWAGAYARAQQEAANVARNQVTTTPSTSRDSSAANSQAVSSVASSTNTTEQVYSVNLNIGGNTTTVRMASGQDAQSLISALTELQKRAA